jgi:hypothetical protein
MNPRDSQISSEEYEVEKILGERKRNSKIYYQVDGKDTMWNMTLGRLPETCEMPLN